jgi:hypothetical protein
MSATAILADLAQRGVHLHPDGDRLHVDAPRGVLTPALLETLRAHKPELLAELESRAVTLQNSAGVTARTVPLKTCAPVTRVTPKNDDAEIPAYDAEALEERAAILHFEAGFSRAEADARALPATVALPSSAVARAVAGRVWAVTLREYGEIIMLTRELLTLAEAEAVILKGPLGLRVIQVREHRT